MLDLGAQVAYLVLAVGTPVYASDESPVGRVSEVLAVGNDDIFDGLMVAGDDGPHYVMADHVQCIYEQGVILALDPAGFAATPDRLG